MNSFQNNFQQGDSAGKAAPVSRKFSAENPQRDIRVSAMNLLARREYAYQELFTKLSNKFSKSEHHPQSLIEEQLQRLCDEGLQNDERFVEAFVNYRKNSGKGPLLVRQQLQQKGVAAELIALALEAIEEEWFGLAEELYRRKYSGKPITDQKEKAKRIRFMQNRGYFTDHFLHLVD